MGSVLLPGKADSILIVDSDAVLPLAISLKRFQAIAGRYPEIGDGQRIIQREQAALGNRRDVRELSIVRQVYNAIVSHAALFAAPAATRPRSARSSTAERAFPGLAGSGRGEE
jgi:hypothetical protein